VTLDERRSGEALRTVAGDLARVWRASRFAGGAVEFPGLLDGVMEEFIERVGEALLLGTAPESVWPSTRGVVRILPGDRTSATLSEEWRLVNEVLIAACLALEVADDATEKIRVAIETASRSVAPLLAHGGPAGVLLVHQLGGFHPRGDAHGGRP
jgi:hypothetical protein